MIEFRGVGEVFPVSGEPGAQAKIARSTPQGRVARAGQARVKRELLAETNEPCITSELLILWSRLGFAPTPTGAKAPICLRSTARLKPCPSTKLIFPSVKLTFSLL